MKRLDLANYIVIIVLILFFALLIWSHYWNGPVVVEGWAQTELKIMITPEQQKSIDNIEDKVDAIAERIVGIMGHIPASISDISICSISDIPYNETKANNKANIDISMNLNVVPIKNKNNILSDIFEDFHNQFPALEIKTGKWNLNIKIPRGPRGEKGEKGDPGADGAQGAVGMEGDEGPRGERGA